MQKQKYIINARLTARLHSSKFYSSNSLATQFVKILHHQTFAPYGIATDSQGGSPTFQIRISQGQCPMRCPSPLSSYKPGRYLYVQALKPAFLIQIVWYNYTIATQLKTSYYNIILIIINYETVAITNSGIACINNSIQLANSYIVIMHACVVYNMFLYHIHHNSRICVQQFLVVIMYYIKHLLASYIYK